MLEADTTFIPVPDDDIENQPPHTPDVIAKARYAPRLAIPLATQHLNIPMKLFGMWFTAWSSEGSRGQDAPGF